MNNMYLFYADVVLKHLMNLVAQRTYYDYDARANKTKSEGICE